MRGLMQDWPLLAHTILDHAARFHPRRDVVSRSVEGPIHRTNYAEIHSRARRVATHARSHQQHEAGMGRTVHAADMRTEFVTRLVTQ